MNKISRVIFVILISTPALAQQDKSKIEFSVPSKERERGKGNRTYCAVKNPTQLPMGNYIILIKDLCVQFREAHEGVYYAINSSTSFTQVEAKNAPPNMAEDWSKRLSATHDFFENNKFKVNVNLGDWPARLCGIRNVQFEEKPKMKPGVPILDNADILGTIHFTFWTHPKHPC